MGIKQNIETFIKNPDIQKKYLKWNATRLFKGHPPSIELPMGRQLFPADRFNDYQAITVQHPDMSEFNLVNSLLPASSTGIFVDVGANVGAMSLLVHSTGKTEHIIAFEPSHRYCSAWHYNMSKNLVDNATLIQTAVGDFNGEINFRVDPAMPLNNKIDKGKVHFTSQVQKVRIVTLDSIFESLNLPVIHLLKLDVEGAEPLVIRGAKNLLKQEKIHNILFEFIVEFIEDMDESAYDLIDALNNCDFDFYQINLNGSLTKIVDYKSIVDTRRVEPDHPERPFHQINLVAKLNKQ
jgi:FkbM family methyltransferase